MRLEDHPGWRWAETITILGFALAFLYLNASQFDSTEWETMKELLIVALGLKLIGSRSWKKE